MAFYGLLAMMDHQPIAMTTLGGKLPFAKRLLNSGEQDDRPEKNRQAPECQGHPEEHRLVSAAIPRKD
jgi:hypothetical protein